MKPHEQPPRSVPEELEDNKDIKYAERYFRRRRIATKIIATLGLLEMIYVSGYKLPIILEQMRLAETNPVLHQVSDVPDALFSETIVIGGFGIKSSEPTALALPQLSEIGGVKALEQDNAGIDVHIIAKMIISQAEAQGLSEIGLWGDSNGGLIATKVAREIQESDSNLRVRFIVLDCTPTSTDTLRDDKRDTVDLLDSASNIFPDIATHPLVSYLYAQDRLDKKYNGEVSIAVGQIFDEMYRQDQPSSTLLAAQALLIVNPSLARDLEAISEVTDKDPPLIISIRPTSSTADRTVISLDAQGELTEILSKTRLTHISIRLDDIVHGDPTANKQPYQEALTTIILPALERYEQALDLNHGY